MTRRREGGVRVALVDPGTLVGRDVRAVLDERAFPYAGIELFQTAAPDAGLLVENEDEAAYVAPLLPDSLGDHAVAFLCGGAAATSAALARRRDYACLAIDLSGARDGGPFAVPGAPLPAARRVLLPDPTATVVAEALRRVDAVARVASLFLAVDRPVSELGKGALDELFQQALAVASFRAVPKETLGTQAVFNAHYPADSAAWERRVAEDVARLTAATLGRALPTEVFACRAGVFHGHHIRLDVRFEAEAPDAGALLSALGADASAFEAVDADDLAGPVEAAGRDETLVLRVASGNGRAKIALASDHLRRAGAVLAVKFAEEALLSRGLP